MVEAVTKLDPLKKLMLNMREIKLSREDHKVQNN